MHTKPAVLGGIVSCLAVGSCAVYAIERRMKNQGSRVLRRLNQRLSVYTAAVVVWRFTGEDSISLSIDGKVIPFEFSADGTTVAHLLKLVSDAEAGSDGDATAVVHCAGKDGVSAGHGEMVFCCTPSAGAAWEIWVEYDEGSFAAACGHVD